MSTYLVTGSNRGIGLEICNQLHKRGDNVIATCRTISDELKKLKVRVVENVDISSTHSIGLLKNNLKEARLDCLIHNAGIYEYNTLMDLEAESIRRQFEINALRPLLITKAMTGLLKRNSKIVFISSRMGSIEDNTSGSSYGYRMSKVALSMAAKSLSVDLSKKGIYIGILHPGLVRTRMTGFTKNGISTEESVNGLLKRIDAINKKNTGKFWHANGEELPW